MAYLIKPTNVITGAQAPGIISFCEKTEDAILDVKSRSSLSKYDRWSFKTSVVHIKDRVKKQKFNTED